MEDCGFKSWDELTERERIEFINELLDDFVETVREGSPTPLNAMEVVQQSCWQLWDSAGKPEGRSAVRFLKWVLEGKSISFSKLVAELPPYQKAMNKLIYERLDRQDRIKAAELARSQRADDGFDLF